MQVMFVLGLEFALAKSDELAPSEITRIGLQDDMTFIGSAAALNRSWVTIEGALAEAGHRLRSCKCGVWAPGLSSSRTQNCRSRFEICHGVSRGCVERTALHACRPGPTC